MSDQSGNTAQPWYDSEEHFATQLEGRLAQQLGRALLDATAAQIRSEMAQGRAAALGERVKEIEDCVTDLNANYMQALNEVDQLKEQLLPTDDGGRPARRSRNP